MLKMINSLIN